MSVGRVNCCWSSPGHDCSESRGTHDHMLLSHDSESHEIFPSLHTAYLIRHGPHRKHRVRQFYCFGCIRCRGKVFAEPLPSNNRARPRHADSRVIFIFFQNKENKARKSINLLNSRNCTKTQTGSLQPSCDHDNFLCSFNTYHATVRMIGYLISCFSYINYNDSFHVLPW
jgi:hypothetical protein